MAGDWIKMRGALLDHPKVIAVSRRLIAQKPFREWLTPGSSGPVNGQIISDSALRAVTVALLLRLWSASREHGIFVGDDLVLRHNTMSDLDQLAGAPGFGAAIQSVGWALEKDGVTLPNFKQYNAPMTNSERQQEYRNRHKKSVLGKRNGVVTKRVTKRNEKVTKSLFSLSISPSSSDSCISEGGSGGKQAHPADFEAFWKAYPARGGRKVGKAKSLKLWNGIDAAERELVQQAAVNYAASDQSLKGYTRDPERFLKDDWWREWVESTAPHPILSEKTKRNMAAAESFLAKYGEKNGDLKPNS